MKLAKFIFFILILLLSLGILNVTIAYFSPDFQTGFLKGKSNFYEQPIFKYSLISHGISASLSAIVIAFLIFFRIEKKFPTAHRTSGKLVLFFTLFVVFPSGFILSFYADGGKIARILFLLLSASVCFTAISALQEAKKKRFLNHKIWMEYLLLLFCSAFILRITIVIFVFLKIHSKSIYPLEVFLSWVPSSILFWNFNYRKLHRK